MNKIVSFTVDHTKLAEGIYVSSVLGDITTYDLRFRKPNCNNYLDNVTMHTIEHMFATYIRNGNLKDNVIYFGPMGCQTGFYLLMRNADNNKLLAEVKTVLQKIIEHTGEVFGKSQIECGNYMSLNLQKAQVECKNYLQILNNKTNDFKYKE